MAACFDSSTVRRPTGSSGRNTNGNSLVGVDRFIVSRANGQVRRNIGQ